jgi:cytochrome c oxidase assembly protein subunit 15
MAVPDAFTTYGSISFLAPISLMAGEVGDSRIFLEHTHRLFGTLVGLVTLMVAVFAWRHDRRPSARILATVVFVLVCVQGILGALRVGENSALLAMLHGIFGQLVFATGVTLAALLSPLGQTVKKNDTDDATAHVGRRSRGFAVAALACVVVQLSFGAASRHLGASHATWAHAAFAFIVAAVVFATAALARSAPATDAGGRTLRRTGTWIGVLVGVQFLLGFVVLWQIMQPDAQRPIPLAGELATAPPMDLLEAGVTTAHQTIGAGLLALMTLAAFWTRRLAGFARNPSIAAPNTAQ